MKLSKGLKYSKGNNFAASSPGRCSLGETDSPHSRLHAAPSAGTQVVPRADGQSASTPPDLSKFWFHGPSALAITLLLFYAVTWQDLPWNLQEVEIFDYCKTVPCRAGRRLLHYPCVSVRVAVSFHPHCPIKPAKMPRPLHDLGNVMLWKMFKCWSCYWMSLIKSSHYFLFHEVWGFFLHWVFSILGLFSLWISIGRASERRNNQMRVMLPYSLQIQI